MIPPVALYVGIVEKLGDHPVFSLLCHIIELLGRV